MPVVKAIGVSCAAPTLVDTHGQAVVTEFADVGVETTQIITHATGAYTVPQYSNAMVDTTTGSIGTLTLGTGPLGATFEVDDYAMFCNVNNITVAPAAGCQLEDPNNLGVYQLAGVACVFATPGLTARWRFDGVSKYKCVSVTT